MLLGFLFLLTCVNNLSTCVNNLRHLHCVWLVFGGILQNEMWLSYTCAPCLSVGWSVNTRASDSVLAPVFTEREINKLLNLRLDNILSSSRVHLGQGYQVFLCLWPSFERTGCLRKTPSLYLSPSFVFKGRLKGLHSLLTAARLSGRER